jgi:hypothetical protein
MFSESLEHRKWETQLINYHLDEVELCPPPKKIKIIKLTRPILSLFGMETVSYI